MKALFAPAAVAADKYLQPKKKTIMCGGATAMTHAGTALVVVQAPAPGATAVIISPDQEAIAALRLLRERQI